MKKIGYTCAYTPLPLIEAAGFAPYRVLPVGAVPDRAGQVLHDNLCRHVKLILDRKMAGEVPELAGMVLMSSCDAMRRLRDAWVDRCPDVPCILVDLPGTASGASQSWFAGSLERLAETLEEWGGMAFREEELAGLIGLYNQAAGLFRQLEARLARGSLAGGATRLQELYDEASGARVERVLENLQAALLEPEQEAASGSPVYLFGNVLPDPEAMGVFEQCGARVVAADFCTGSRAFDSFALEDGEDPYPALARGLLGKAPCARTLSKAGPGSLATHVVEQARRSGAAGVICHTLKFCDPYLFRIPRVQDELKKAGLSMLLLEGDCTLGSLGQQRTRIEAFVETLEGGHAA